METRVCRDPGKELVETWIGRWLRGELVRPMRAEEEISFNQCNQTVTDLHQSHSEIKARMKNWMPFFSAIYGIDRNCVETNFHGDKTFDMVSIFWWKWKVDGDDGDNAWPWMPACPAPQVIPKSPLLSALPGDDDNDQNITKTDSWLPKNDDKCDAKRIVIIMDNGNLGAAL